MATKKVFFGTLFKFTELGVAEINAALKERFPERKDVPFVSYDKNAHFFSCNVALDDADLIEFVTIKIHNYTTLHSRNRDSAGSERIHPIPGTLLAAEDSSDEEDSNMTSEIQSPLSSKFLGKKDAQRVEEWRQNTHMVTSAEPQTDAVQGGPRKRVVADLSSDDSGSDSGPDLLVFDESDNEGPGQARRSGVNDSKSRHEKSKIPAITAPALPQHRVTEHAARVELDVLPPRAEYVPQYTVPKRNIDYLKGQTLSLLESRMPGSQQNSTTNKKSSVASPNQKVAAVRHSTAGSILPGDSASQVGGETLTRVGNGRRGKIDKPAGFW